MGIKLIEKYNFYFNEVKKNPGAFHLIIRLAEICLMLNKKEEALLYLKRALRLKPYDEYVRSLIKYNFDEDKIRDIVFAQKPKPFYNDVKSLLLYPFKNVGITRLIFLSLIGMFFSLVPLFNFLLIVIVYFPIIAIYLFSILQSTIRGEPVLKEFLPFADIWEDVLRPYFLILVSLCTSFLPLLIYWFVDLYLRIKLNVLVPIGIVTGIIFFPMSLLLSAELESFSTPFLFRMAVVSILKMRYYYLLVILSFICFFILELLVIVVIPVIPILWSLFFWFPTLYFCTILMYIWGNIYVISYR